MRGRGPNARGNGPHAPWPSPPLAPTIGTETGAPRMAPRSMMPRLETILLATDGSTASEPASEQAIDLATQVQARLLVVSVLASARQPTEAAASAGDPDSRDSMAARAQGIVQRAKAAGANATYMVWEGEAGEAIVAAADSESADLIIVGSHGRSGVSRFLIGSVSDFVVRHAHCPVMVVRGRLDTVRR
jgi:nucleotide-binding universal stress UspA family protein